MPSRNSGTQGLYEVAWDYYRREPEEWDYPRTRAEEFQEGVNRILSDYIHNDFLHDIEGENETTYHIGDWVQVTAEGRDKGRIFRVAEVWEERSSWRRL